MFYINKSFERQKYADCFDIISYFFNYLETKVTHPLPFARILASLLRTKGYAVAKYLFSKKTEGLGIILPYLCHHCFVEVFAKILLIEVPFLDDKFDNNKIYLLKMIFTFLLNSAADTDVSIITTIIRTYLDSGKTVELLMNDIIFDTLLLTIKSNKRNVLSQGLDMLKAIMLVFKVEYEKSQKFVSIVSFASSV